MADRGDGSMVVEVRVAIALDGSWQKFRGPVPDGSDTECYALPLRASRAKFWGKRLGMEIPDGRGLIWEILDGDAGESA